jgi:hypothetical protein
VSWARSFGRQALFGFTLRAAAAGILAGCAEPPPPPAPPAPRLAAARLLPSPLLAVQRPGPGPVPLPARKPVAPPEPGGAAPEDQAMATSAPPPQNPAVAMAAPQPPQNPALPAYPTASEALIGLDQKTAMRLFGTAQEKSEKPPATVWRWRSGTCELDLYFYLDLSSGEMRSLHYVFKGDATGQQDCLKSLALAAGG